MAKRKKSRKKSSKCPEPFNTLIDLAGAATLDYIAYKRRQKNCGKRAKIDPYAVTGVAMGMGKLNNTGDIIRLGGMLGAMGAFDDDDSSWEYSGVGSSFQKPLNNRYAWRLNCEDGSEYGVYPESYETRAAFDAALSRAKQSRIPDESPKEKETLTERKEAITPDFVSDQEVRIYCRVSRLDNGENAYYLSDTEDISVSSVVSVPGEDSEPHKGVILSIEKHTAATAPTDPDTAKYIIKEGT